MTAPDTPKLCWKLSVVMAMRGIRTARDLRNKLRQTGFEISEAQLSRVRYALPQKLDTQLLAALCEVLQTTPADLISVPQVATQSRPAADSPRRTPKAEGVNESKGERRPAIPREYPVCGPRLHAMRFEEK